MLKFLHSFMKRDLEMSCFNPLAGILPEPLAKGFASLSESYSSSTRSVKERHSKTTKEFTKCHKMSWFCYKTNGKRFSVYYYKSVLLMREEVVITPVRRGGGTLSIWSPIDRLAMHPSALLLTRKQLTSISSLSTLTISTPRQKSFPSRMALEFQQLRCILYGVSEDIKVHCSGSRWTSALKKQEARPLGYGLVKLLPLFGA